MIRIVVQRSEAGMAANVGGPVHTSVKTFDLDAPEFEAYMRAERGTYEDKMVVGVEILP